MNTHAAKSPSRFQRLRLCPGSYLAEQKYPESPSGPSAIDGTHTHSLLELAIKENLPAITYLNRTLSDHEGEFVVDGERCLRVQVALDYIKKRATELDVDVHHIHPEVTLASGKAFGRDDMGGTCDIHIVALPARVLEVADYKDGMGVVELPCDQLDLYTLMVMADYPEGSFDTVRQTIIQPKLAYRGEKGVTFIDRPAQELWDQRFSYSMAAQFAESENAPFVPGELQCKYCAHKGAPCPALNAQMMAASGIAFPNVNVDVATQAAGKDTKELSNEKLRELLEAAPLLRQLLDAADAEAMRRFEVGEPIEGLKVVKGRGSRAWAFDDDVMAEKLKKFGIPKTSLYKTKLVSPAQAEKLVWQNTKKETKQLSDRQLKMMKDDYVTEFEGKLIVVPASDTREAVLLSAAPLFDAIEVVPDFLKLPDFLKIAN